MAADIVQRLLDAVAHLDKGARLVSNTGKYRSDNNDGRAAQTCEDAATEIESLRAERDRLRAALIDCGREVGGGLADAVSTDFLMNVPTEVRLVTDRLRARVGELEGALRKPDLAIIEAAARKVNPGRTEDHIKSVALDALSIIRAIAAAETTK